MISLIETYVLISKANISSDPFNIVQVRSKLPSEVQDHMDKFDLFILRLVLVNMDCSDVTLSLTNNNEIIFKICSNNNIISQERKLLGNIVKSIKNLKHNCLEIPTPLFQGVSVKVYFSLDKTDKDPKKVMEGLINLQKKRVSKKKQKSSSTPLDASSHEKSRDKA